MRSVVSSKTIKVRRAEPKDIVNIAKLLSGGWNQQTLQFAPIDDACGYRWILGILEEGFVVVADLNGRIVGTACANPYRPQWSRQWLMDMTFLYVLPAFRRDGVAEKLIQAVTNFADKHGAGLTFGIETLDKPLIKDRLLKIAGWIYTGGNFLRPPKEDGQGQDDNKHDAAESTS